MGTVSAKSSPAQSAPHLTMPAGLEHQHIRKLSLSCVELISTAVAGITCNGLKRAFYAACTVHAILGH